MITFRVRLSPRLSLHCKSVSKTGYVRGTNLCTLFVRPLWQLSVERALVQLRIKPMSLHTLQQHFALMCQKSQTHKDFLTVFWKYYYICIKIHPAMLLSRSGLSVWKHAPVLWMVHALQDANQCVMVVTQDFSKTCFCNIHSIPCFVRQWKQLLDAREMTNKKLNKLHYYLKQGFNCFVALNLTVNISASAVDFVIILD